MVRQTWPPCRVVVPRLERECPANSQLAPAMGAATGTAVNPPARAPRKARPGSGKPTTSTGAIPARQWPSVKRSRSYSEKSGRC